MTELLKLIGFSEKERAAFRNESQLFLQIIGADEECCDAAAEKLPEYYDLNFQSLRMLLKHLLETVFIDLRTLTCRTEGISIIQAAVPMPVVVPAVINELNRTVRVSFSEYLIIYLSGILFNRFENFCSSGEHSCGRCGLNLSREKLYTNKAYPHPEKIMSCLGYCDELYKTGEALSLLFEIKHTHLKGIPGLDFEAQKVFIEDGLAAFLSENTGVTKQEAAICLGRNNDRSLEISLLIDKINRLIAAERNAFVTFNETSLLNLFNLVYLPEHFIKAKEILKLFIRELLEKKRAGDYSLISPLRVGCLHLPFTNPQVDRIFRNNGAAVIVSSFYLNAVGKEQPENEFERSIRAFYGCRAPGILKDKAVLVDRIIEDYNLDCFLFGQFENDRALGGDQLMVMKLLKNKERIHYMNMNNWAVIGERETTRIESLLEILKERQQWKCLKKRKVSVPSV